MSINGLKPKIGAILTSDFSIFRLNFPFLPQCDVNGLTHFNLDVPNGQLTKIHVLSLGTLKYPVMLFSRNKKEQEGTQKLV